jgi:tetratricopeptide (TPR) repeat protein
MGANPMRHIRMIALTGAAVAAAFTVTGCNKLKARDNLNQGVLAFKAGNYSQAADHFKTAIDEDPGLPAARVYLATAYVQQYVPGTDTPDNKKFADAAMKEFQTVLASNPDGQYKLLATQSVANLYYQQHDFPNAAEWEHKVIQLDPKNKEAYYTLGVIAWTDFIAPDREARNKMGMKPEEPGPLKDAKAREELKAKFWQPLTDGIDDEKHALQIDPEYENAMAYMNLLIRYRADLDDTKDQYQADSKEADNWVQKALETQKIKAARKAANPNAKQ